MIRTITLVAGLSTTLFAMSSCVSSSPSLTSSATNKRSVTFNFTPAGTLVELYDRKSGVVTDSCKTPCKLQFFLVAPPDYTLSYPGKVDRHGTFSASNMDRNGQKFGSSGFINEIAYAGDFTMSGKMMTEAEKRQFDEEQAQKVRDFKAQREEMQKFSEAQKEAYRTGDLSQLEALMKTQPTQCPAGTVSTENKDVKPLVWGSPIMPAAANKSGHCKLRFNVNTAGKPTEIKAEFCTDEVFRISSIASVSRMQFTPKQEAGRHVDICGVEKKISYRLMGKDGKIIPE